MWNLKEQVVPAWLEEGSGITCGEAAVPRIQQYKNLLCKLLGSGMAEHI